MPERQRPLFAPSPSTGTEPAEVPPKLVVIDGHALAYRSYYAIRDLTTSTGRPVNAVFGFLRSLLKILAEEGDRDATVVVFDAPAKTFRHEQFDAYKAGRAPTPDDFPGQVDTIRTLVDLLGLHRTELPGLEADDLMGTIACRCSTAGWRVELLTSDRDAYQLVSERVVVRGLDRRDRMGPDDVFAKYGVRVDQWTDYRALTGDSSDNIPGARGIGPVSARTLLERYGSLDAILGDLDAVEPAGYANKIRAAREDVELSRALSRIVTDADIEVEPERWAQRDLNEDALADLLRELEFGAILADLGLLAAGSTAATDAELHDVAWRDRPAGGMLGFALDDDRPFGAQVRALAVADGGRVASTEDGADVRDALATQERIDACDAKALCVAAHALGASVEPGDDPLLMAYALDTTNTDPATVVERYGAGRWRADDAAARAACGVRLRNALDDRFDERRQALYGDLEQPLQAVLAQMEIRGMLLDVAELARQGRELGAEIDVVATRLREAAADPDFNPNSRDQVATLLYDRLGLAAGATTSTGKRSTAVSVLEKLADEHPAVRDILAYRELTKLKSTYLDPLPELVNRDTGRIHTTYRQNVVATGRLSSANPNLQNIPVRTDAGRRIRRAFVAPEGQVLVAADYSQVELRILAHIAQEPALIDAFLEDDDIHRRTAATIHDTEPAAVTDAQRRIAKTINFGVLYGMSAHRLARELDLPYGDAKAFIERYFERYPHVRRYIDETIAFCREHGYAETLLGRRRSIPDIRSRNRNARAYAERTAYNLPIQGSAADIMKRAMLRLAPHLADLGAGMVLQVHDELVVEAPARVASDVAAAVQRGMEGAFDLDVPLAVSVGIGPTWLDAKR